MKVLLIIGGGIAIVAVIAILAVVVVPLVMVSDQASEMTAEPIDMQDAAAVKPHVLDICNRMMSELVPDPLKADQRKYTCACVWAKAEPLMPGRSAAEVSSILMKTDGTKPDIITECAMQVGLIPPPQ